MIDLTQFHKNHINEVIFHSRYYYEKMFIRPLKELSQLQTGNNHNHRIRNKKVSSNNFTVYDRDNRCPFHNWISVGSNECNLDVVDVQGCKVYIQNS